MGAVRPPARRHDPGSPPDPVIPPGPSPVDLHTHSTRSDGVLEPAVLLGAAAAAGVRLLALTDHDTLAGCRDVLSTGAVPDGLELITGIEINAVVDRQDLWESELHILGFGMDPADDEFEIDPRDPASTTPRTVRANRGPSARARTPDRRTTG